MTPFCTLCHKPFVPGQPYLINSWGEPFCQEHLQQYPMCFACQRLVLPGQGRTYPDNGVICQVCCQTAINTKEQAKPIVEGLANWLSQCGLRFKGLRLKIEVLDSIALAHKHGQNQPEGRILGNFRRILQVYNDHERRIVDGITLLQGLPQELFEGTVVHELGHAWLYLAKIDHLPRWQEEGFCNLLAYILHKDRPTPEARWQVKVLENDPDPIYGEGFRRVRALFKKHGFGEALNYTFYHRQFPPE